METIVIETRIAAPIERCFDAARDLDVHVKTLAHTGEVAVAGRTNGLIELGESVTWRGRHFGITQLFTSRITAYERPRYFQDTMEKGAFRTFVHDHYFRTEGGDTTMTDMLEFSAPLGFLGRIAEVLVLKRYMTRLLKRRADVIKQVLEERS